ncbi:MULTISPECIES: hypothetical protein [Pacificibacter]|uniref:hypothetical protein n=1 Tax=Pacificibacter TaxID=1042323 RepID=UPI001C090E98|nr:MULTISPECIES: hypothetical protein [Pacificibacter]MBU2934813.1 hypothetical protein [Pacificibacter marinus]MDO6615787.1 hypothetical protein [Pacificibacter sp. 1_MG-2023]
MRDGIQTLVALGPVPNPDDSEWYWTTFEAAVDGIVPPVSDLEAQALLTLFGPEESQNGFGLACALVHLIETAPTPWPKEEPQVTDGYWLRLLYARQRGA